MEEMTKEQWKDAYVTEDAFRLIKKAWLMGNDSEAFQRFLLMQKDKKQELLLELNDRQGESDAWKADFMRYIIKNTDCVILQTYEPNQ